MALNRCHFIDGDELNYNLSKLSTFLNTGRIEDALVIDLTGSLHLSDGFVDVGAIESNSNYSYQSMDWVISNNLGHSGARYTNGTITISGASFVRPFSNHQLYYFSSFLAERIFGLHVNTVFELYPEDCN